MLVAGRVRLRGWARWRGSALAAAGVVHDRLFRRREPNSIHDHQKCEATVHFRAHTAW